MRKNLSEMEGFFVFKILMNNPKRQLKRQLLFLTFDNQIVIGYNQEAHLVEFYMLIYMFIAVFIACS